MIKTELTDRATKIGLYLITILFVFFFFLISLSIHFFPDNYNFFTSYLSELGVNTTIHGHANYISSFLFHFAIIVFGFLSGFFWIISQNIIRYKIDLPDNFDKIILVGFVSGLMSSIFTILLGIYPYNYMNSVHIFLSNVFFAFNGLACLIYAGIFIYLNINSLRDRDIFKQSVLPLGILLLIPLIIRSNFDKTFVLTILLSGVLVILIIYELLMIKNDFISFLIYFCSFSFFTLLTFITLLILSVNFNAIIEMSYISAILLFLILSISFLNHKLNFYYLKGGQNICHTK